eukprot:9391806-Alexandrium_andersonii.AAC.1
MASESSAESSATSASSAAPRSMEDELDALLGLPAKDMDEEASGDGDMEGSESEACVDAELKLGNADDGPEEKPLCEA